MRKLMDGLLLAACLMMAGQAHAQTRTATFEVRCDGQASGSANLSVILEHQVVFFDHDCLPGTDSITALTMIPDSAGTVRKTTVTVTTTNQAGKANTCDLTASHGLVDGMCLTDSSPNGPIDAVHVTVHIPNGQ